jgi:hypothetical protein
MLRAKSRPISNEVYILPTQKLQFNILHGRNRQLTATNERGDTEIWIAGQGSGLV